MSRLPQDLRLAVRRLLRSPGFSLSVLLILTLGIGANTANFSIVNAVLLRPLPFDDAERLVHLYRTDPQRGIDVLRFSLPLYLDLEERSRVFSDLGAYFYTSRNITGGDAEAETLVVGRLTADLLPLLGAEPVLGRVFDPSEARPGADRVVLLSDAVWRRRFAADRGVLGRTLEVARTAGPPLAAAASVRATVESVGSGVPVTRVRTMEQVVGASLKPWESSAQVLAGLAVLALLLAGIGIYAVVTYAVRQREREIGIRIALGADRRRVASLTLGHGARLALVGLGIGLLLSVALTRLLSSLLFGIGALDPVAFASAVLVLAATVLLATLVPTRRAARLDPVEALRGE